MDSIRQDWGVFTLIWVVVFVLVAAFLLVLFRLYIQQFGRQTCAMAPLYALYCLTTAFPRLRHITPRCPAGARPLLTFWTTDCPP